jgi:hypothetical protein
MSLIRVLQIPAPTGNFHFSGPEHAAFWELDWFRDDHMPLSAETREKYERFIREKRYYHDERPLLILGPDYAFTMGYSAP